MVVQATEYNKIDTEVNAEDILKHIENNDDINLTNCIIVGEFNISNIKLKTVPNPSFYELLNKGYSKEELVYDGLNEKSSEVESNITIKNSIFEKSLNFSNVHFENFVSCEGATFRDVNFKGASFSNPADFYNTTFGNSANFSFANFIYSANFDETTFGDSADFRSANFGNYVNLNDSTEESIFRVIRRSADFNWASFGDGASFTETDLGDYADFTGANFGNSANFCSANFGNSANFIITNFGDFANFWGVEFGDSAHFDGANFGNYANFLNIHFTDNIEFYGPDTSKNIFTDGKSLELFIKNYNSEARYEDADNIYYNYRRYSQDRKSLLSLSKWIDIISWITCGYGLKPSRTLYFGGFVVLLFSIIYAKGPTIYLTKSRNKETFLRFYWQGPGIIRKEEKYDNQHHGISFRDAFYFSMNTFTTVGYGNWYPKESFRKWATFEGLLGWITLGIFMATLTNVMIRS